MSAPAAFARALLAAHYLLPHCGLSVSARDSVGARFSRAAFAAGLSLDRPGEVLTLTFPATPELRLAALRSLLGDALHFAPDAAHHDLRRAESHLPPGPCVRPFEAGPACSCGGLEEGGAR